MNNHYISKSQTFSERHNLKPTLPIQKNTMSTELKNRLWNACNQDIFQPGIIRYPGTCWKPNMENDINTLWDGFFKQVITYMLKNPDFTINEISKQFDYLSCSEVYDFIEFIIENFSCFNYEDIKNNFIYKCNNILENENSAYTIDNDKVIEKISELESDSIHSAIQGSPDEVKEHLNKAKGFYFDRNKLDYKNCIKESVSAIESYCMNITGKTSDTLGTLINDVKFQSLHSSMKEAIKKIYGYASDKSGVRHCNKNGEPPVTKEEALFILVTSSAIINFLNDFISENRS